MQQEIHSQKPFPRFALLGTPIPQNHGLHPGILFMPRHGYILISHPFPDKPGFLCHNVPLLGEEVFGGIQRPGGVLTRQGDR